MKQLTKGRSIVYHLYPGVLITFGFVLLAPLAMRYGFPPQFGMLISILLLAVPILLAHLIAARKDEGLSKLRDINGFTARLPFGKLFLYSLGLVVFAFLIWGLTQPLNKIITDHFLTGLPDWYTVQDFSGYDKEKIKITLLFNLILNGILAPYLEELYFRGYLLPRMNIWGKGSYIMSALLFSLYHFWQPYIYLTLIISLLPMTYLVWKTRDLRLAIVTHCLLNLIGALLSFGLVM
jgi:membrane protease YdiL (CAAX protease family)